MCLPHYVTVTSSCVSCVLWYSGLEHQHQRHYQRWCSGKHMPRTYLHIPLNHSHTCSTPLNEFHHVTQCHCLYQSYVELNELLGVKWQETGRWVGYEETFNPTTGKWGSSHISCLTFRSLIQLRKVMSTGEIWDISNEICVVKIMTQKILLMLCVWFCLNAF